MGSVGVVAEREGELEAGVKTESVSKPGAEAEGEGELEAKASVEPGAERVTKPAAKAQDPLEFEPDAKQESVLDAKTDDDLDGEPDPDPDAEPEFPQTCAAFACGRHPRVRVSVLVFATFLPFRTRCSSPQPTRIRLSKLGFPQVGLVCVGRQHEALRVP